MARYVSVKLALADHLMEDQYAAVVYTGFVDGQGNKLVVEVPTSSVSEINEEGPKDHNVIRGQQAQIDLLKKTLNIEGDVKRWCKRFRKQMCSIKEKLQDEERKQVKFGSDIWENPPVKQGVCDRLISTHTLTDKGKETFDDLFGSKEHPYKGRVDEERRRTARKMVGR